MKTYFHKSAELRKLATLVWRRHDNCSWCGDFCNTTHNNSEFPAKLGYG